VSAGSDRLTPRLATVAPSVRPPHAAGGAGTPAIAIAPRTRANNIGVTRAGATANVEPSLPAIPARASAQQEIRKIFREALATGQAATSYSCPRPARRSNTSVVPRADRRSGVFASVRYASESDGDMALGRAGCRVGGHQRPRVDVVEYLA
jgi:hypothetical protein